MPEAQPRALREGNARRFLCEVEPRTQLLIGLEFFQNKLFTESSRTYRRSILVFSSDDKREKRQIVFSITWTRQEPCGLVGSSVISDPGVPGSNSTVVNPLLLCHFFFSKWGQQKISKSFTSTAMASAHVRQWSLWKPPSLVWGYYWAVSTLVGGYYVNNIHRARVNIGWYLASAIWPEVRTVDRVYIFAEPQARQISTRSTVRTEGHITS